MISKKKWPEIGTNFSKTFDLSFFGQLKQANENRIFTLFPGCCKFLAYIFKYAKT